MKIPGHGTDVFGNPATSELELEHGKGLIKEFNEGQLAEYTNAQKGMAQLATMTNSLDSLTKGGGFLVPGTAAELRVDIAKTGNTIMTMLGEKPIFDPDKIASAEEFVKDTNRLAITVTNQMLGGQREAASVIHGIVRSVPALSNTWLGGHLVADGLIAANQRVIDQRNFQTEWAARNRGNLTGSIEAFNNAFPAKIYAQKVLDKYGLTENGFKGLTGLENAVKQKLIEPEQAAKIYQDQFAGKKGQ
jgi:hypothetical protein